MAAEGCGRTTGVAPVSQPLSCAGATARTGAEGVLGRGIGMRGYGVDGAAVPRTVGIRPDVVEERVASGTGMADMAGMAGMADIGCDGCVSTGSRGAGGGARVVRGIA